MFLLTLIHGPRWLRLFEHVDANHIPGPTESQTFNQSHFQELGRYLMKGNVGMSFSGNTLAKSFIHKLAQEILGHIFRLVLTGELCLPHRSVHPPLQSHYPYYPELLSHVCSSWRQICVGLCELWVHIDLDPYRLLTGKLTPRAGAYVLRSGQLPLYVHVHGSQHIPPNLPDDYPTAARLPMGARIHTLDLCINDGYADLCKRALATFIDSCLPGNFVRLIVRNSSFKPPSPIYIMAKNQQVNSSIYHGFPLAVSEVQLNDVLLSCASLQLQGIFFPWTSGAYHGLVELRLTCPGARVEIPEPQLVTILKSSPQLRNLDIRISIQPSDPASPRAEFISLPQLESLAGAIDHEANLAHLVRLIAPGPKPLDVSFHPQNNIDIFVDPPFADYIREFFSRSYVDRLSVPRIEYSVMVNLLMLAPNVRTLVLKHCSWPWGCKYEVQLPNHAGHLDTLYVIDSSISMDDLLELITAFRVEKLVCWKYRPFHGGVDFSRDGLNEALCESEASSSLVVEMLNSSPE